MVPNILKFQTLLHLFYYLIHMLIHNLCQLYLFQDWHFAKKLLGNRDYFKQINELDSSKITPEQAAQAKSFLGETTFEMAENNSKAISQIYKLVNLQPQIGN